MDINELTDTLRGVNSVLALIGLIWLFVDMRVRPEPLSPRRLYLTLSLMGFLASVIYGSAEQIVQNTAPGLWTFLITLSCIGTLVGLYLGRGETLSHHKHSR